MGVEFLVVYTTSGNVHFLFILFCLYVGNTKEFFKNRAQLKAHCMNLSSLSLLSHSVHEYSILRKVD